MVPDKHSIPYGVYMLFALLSVVYLSIFSMATSPLFDIYPEADSDIFIMLGKLFNSGYVPYLEYFDHKGPIIIFIEAIGLRFCEDERLSIFLMQAINLFLSLVLIFTIAKQLLTVKNSIIVVFLSLIMLGFTMPNGNYTEEWCLPFILLAMLFWVRYYFGDTTQFSKWQSLVLGMSFAIIFWLRVNNAGVICAVVMYVFIDQLMLRNWRSIVYLVVFFLIGFLVVSLPIMAYFYHINAFEEMIYATFIFNFKYSSFIVPKYVGSKAIIIQSIIAESLPIIALLLGGIFYYRKKKDTKIILAIALFVFWGIVSTQVGSAFNHYMTVNLPLFVLGSILLISNVESLKKHSSLVGLAVLGVLLLFSSYRIYRDKTNEVNVGIKAVNEAMDEACKLIPDGERDSVFAYHMPTYFYMRTKLMPLKECKYFIYQEGHGIHDTAVFETVNDMVLSRRPLWVFARTPKDTYTQNKDIYTILDEYYTAELENESFILYKKK